MNDEQVDPITHTFPPQICKCHWCSIILLLPPPPLPPLIPMHHCGLASLVVLSPPALLSILHPPSLSLSPFSYLSPSFPHPSSSTFPPAYIPCFSTYDTKRSTIKLSPISFPPTQHFLSQPPSHPLTYHCLPSPLPALPSSPSLPMATTFFISLGALWLKVKIVRLGWCIEDDREQESASKCLNRWMLVQ